MRARTRDKLLLIKTPTANLLITREELVFIVIYIEYKFSTRLPLISIRKKVYSKKRRRK